jgi:signal transduction histidine kinase/ligand-binding sensor domain-containing protein
MSHLPLRLSVACALVCFTVQLNAQKGYHFDSWTTESGLPIDFVRALVQTRDGYLWLTTGNGIARFDGVRFRTFLSTDTPGISGDNYAVFALREDRRGTLWAGTIRGGVVSYRNGTFRSFTTKDGLPSNEILRIDEDESGNVWVFTDKGVACLTEVRGIEQVSPRPILSAQSFSKPDRVVGFDSPHLGLWRIDSQHLLRFAYGRWSVFPLPPGLKDAAKLSILSIYEDTKHRVWYNARGFEGQYFCVENGRQSVYRGVPRDAFVSYKDRDGWLWLTDHEGHVARWKDGKLAPVSDFSTPFMLIPFEDQSGGFWIATANAGLFHHRPLSVTCIRRPGRPEVSSTLMRDKSNNIWIGSWGLSKFGSPAPPIKRHDGSFWPAVTALYEDNDGTFYVGSFHGLAKFRNGRFLQDRFLESAVQGRICAIQRDKLGDLWIGTDDGLYVSHDGRFKRIEANEGLTDRGISAILLDHAGTLWIGTRSGLFYWSGSSFAQFRDPNGSTVGQINSLYEDGAGVLWIGTYGNGLCRIANDRLTRYTTAQGLSTNIVFNLLEDDEGFLWFGSAAGLVRVSKSALNAFAAGKLSSIFSTLLGKADGLLDLDISSLGQPGALKAADGKLWFATTSAYIAIVDPQSISIDVSKPVVRIEECTVDSKPRPCRHDLIISPRDSEIQIQYSALGFYLPAQFRFRYKLEGLDQDWTPAGTRRVAYFSHLPSGNYRFRLAVANSSGLWNPQEGSLQFVIRPPFYATSTFQLAVAMLAGSFFAFVWRYRMGQMRRVQAAQQAFSRQLIASQESERQRIAGELHDSLQQRLVVIKNLALIACKSGSGDAKLRERLEEISSQASGANREVKEIAYNLRPYQLDRLGLTKAIQSLTESINGVSGIAVSAEIANVDAAFPKELEINFYRIVQESLNNIVKHSEASEAVVIVERKLDHVLLIVRDNGRGGAPNVLDTSFPHSGLGLTGIIERSQSLGGKASIRSVQGQGTTVTLEVPVKATPV